MHNYNKVEWNSFVSVATERVAATLKSLRVVYVAKAASKLIRHTGNGVASKVLLELARISGSHPRSD